MGKSGGGGARQTGGPLCRSQVHLELSATVPAGDSGRPPSTAAQSSNPERHRPLPSALVAPPGLSQQNVVCGTKSALLTVSCEEEVSSRLSRQPPERPYKLPGVGHHRQASRRSEGGRQVSLLKRVERAQQLADDPTAEAPVVAPPPLAAERGPGRGPGALLLNIRLRLQDEVWSSSTSLLDLPRRPTSRARSRRSSTGSSRSNGFAITAAERRQPGRRPRGRGGGPRAAGAAASRRLDHRSHGQRPAPDLHRADGQARAGPPDSS